AHERGAADPGQDAVVDGAGHQMKYIVGGTLARRRPIASARATKSASVVAPSTSIRRPPTSAQTIAGTSSVAAPSSRGRAPARARGGALRPPPQDAPPGGPARPAALRPA